MRALAEPAHSHMFDAHNPLAERRTRQVMWLTDMAPVSRTPYSVQTRGSSWPNQSSQSATRRSSIGRWWDWFERGRKISELSREFGCSGWAISRWVRQADRDEGCGDGGLTTAEREELAKLRRENRQLKLEREILSKAAAWFAQETAPNSKRSTDS